MATNQFKPFAIGSGANVLNQAEWEALSSLSQGFQSGIASSAQLNKAWRQSSAIAAAVGQLIADADLDALDDGNIAELKTRLQSAIAISLALGTMASQNANAVEITGGSVSGITDLAVADGGTGASDAAGARSNLGLGSAAVKSTGTSGDAVPLLNTANSWGQDQTFDNGTSDSPAACWAIPGLTLRADLIISSGKTIFRIWWNAGSPSEIAAEYNITDSTAKIFGQDVYTKGNVSSFAQTLLDDADAPTARSTLGAISSAEVPGIIAGMAVGSIGSYIVARADIGTGTGSFPQQAGTTYSGSSLTPSNAAASDAANTTTLTGTWRLMSFLYNADPAGNSDSVGLFQRIA